MDDADFGLLAFAGVCGALSLSLLWARAINLRKRVERLENTVGRIVKLLRKVSHPGLRREFLEEEDQ